MGAGLGNNWNGSIVVTNYTDAPIDITTVQDSKLAEGDRAKVHTVSPRDSYVIFTNKIEALSWERSK